jgi:hypothetical protein
LFGGFYTVRFQVNDAVGRSVTHLRAGKRLGGNSAFAHIGSHQESDDGVTATRSLRMTAELRLMLPA